MNAVLLVTLTLLQFREHSLKFKGNQLSLLKKPVVLHTVGCDFLDLSRRCSIQGFKKELDKFRHCKFKDYIKETVQGCAFNIPVK